MGERAYDSMIERIIASRGSTEEMAAVAEERGWDDAWLEAWTIYGDCVKGAYKTGPTGPATRLRRPRIRICSRRCFHEQACTPRVQVFFWKAPRKVSDP